MTIDTIFQNFLDRLASIPKKHLDVVVAQLETTKSELIELFETASKPKKTKKPTKKPTVKKEKKKDENVVKKPLSSYMLFCKTVEESLLLKTLVLLHRMFQRN